MPNPDFDLMGVEEVQRTLDRMARNIPGEVGAGMFQEAQIEATESRERTPVKEGILKGSHIVEEPVIRGDDISVTISVGGPTADSPEGAGYAIPVHEDLDAFHPVGQAKFLESTINESKPHMAKRIGKRIQLNRLAR